MKLPEQKIYSIFQLICHLFDLGLIFLSFNQYMPGLKKLKISTNNQNLMYRFCKKLTEETYSPSINNQNSGNKVSYIFTFIKKSRKKSAVFLNLSSKAHKLLKR
jgi:hypothetical protein